MPKYIFKYILLLVTIISLLSIKESRASHAAGGDIIYEWISDSTYAFYFKFYRDCTGIEESQIVQLCIHNPCQSTTISRDLFKIDTLPDGRPNGSPVSTGCPNFSNTCQDPSSSLPSYREWWYADTFSLSGVCTNWRFGVSISARNLSVNLGTSGNLYVEATLNNQDFPHNSSTVFYTKPVPYVCIGTPYTYNNGAIDKDKDSLVFESMRPIAGSGSQCSNPLAFTTFQAGQTPPLSLPSNPFQTNNTYSLNTATGNISYTPAQVGAHTTTIRVKEYRNGILVGSTMRDIQIQVQNCNNTGMTIDIDSTSVAGATYINGQVEACINTPFSFCFDIVASVKGSTLVISDNKSLSIPQSTITYNNNTSDSINGCFTWTAPIQDTGLHILTISAKDSTCNSPGISVTQVFTVPVKINAKAPLPTVVSPVELCQYDSVVQLTVNGTNILWYATPSGGTASTSPPTYNTNTPNSTTYYVSHMPNGCFSGRVPLTINIFDTPEMNISASKDTVCMFEDIGILDSIIQTDSTLYSWDVDSGRILQGLYTRQIAADWITSGLKTIVLRTAFNNNCETKDSINVFVEESPVAAFDIKQNVCINEVVKMTPVEQSARYDWAVDEHIINDNSFVSSYELNWDNPGDKYLYLELTSSNGCTNSFGDTVTVHDIPPTKITLESDDLCIGDQFRMYTAEGSRYRYSWSPPQFFNNNNSHNVTGTIESAGYYRLLVTDQWGCVNEDSVFISVAACCDIFVPDAFTPNEDGINDEFGAPELSRHRLLEFMIAHRRGNIVFQTSDPNIRWDGTYKGEKLDVGTYSYYIKYICKGEEVFKKGKLHLIR